MSAEHPPAAPPASASDPAATRARRLRDLAELVKIAGESGFARFRCRFGDLELDLIREAAPAFAPAPAVPAVVSPVAPVAAPPVAAPPAAAPAPAKGHPILSPITGTFYAAGSPGAPPFVKVGDPVAKGTTLCIVEAMKLMNEIKADRDGRVAQVLAANEELVKKGAPLFVLE